MLVAAAEFVAGTAPEGAELLPEVVMSDLLSVLDTVLDAVLDTVLDTALGIAIDTVLQFCSRSGDFNVMIFSHRFTLFTLLS